MTMENPSGNQAGEKPASEMSVEELQALLMKKQAEQQSATEDAGETSVDTSYVDHIESVAGGETPSSQEVVVPTPETPEEQERVAEQIAEEEGKLKANLEEMEGVTAQADEALARTEEALTTDPDDIEAKVLQAKIRDVYSSMQLRLQATMRNLGGTIAGGVISAPLLYGMTGQGAMNGAIDGSVVGAGLGIALASIYALKSVWNKRAARLQVI